MKKTILCFAAFCAVALVGCNNDDPGDTAFDNKIFLSTENKLTTMLVKGDSQGFTQHLTASLAKPESQDITIRFEADAELTSQYNEIFSDAAIPLHSKYYALSSNEDVIHAGSVTSNGIDVQFKELSKLDMDVVYVLPVKLSQANLPILSSQRVIFYVIKGAALINVVGDIDGSSLWVPKWKDESQLNGMTQITMEALIRVRNFDRPISTLMGVENHFLVRFGDANYPGQIQVASSKKNFPPKDAGKVLPTNEWVHVAITYNTSENDLCIYVNGKLQSQGGFPDGALRAINLGKSYREDQESESNRGFWVGHSYAPDRYLSGEIAECRIWNVIRTQEEIAQNFYRVDPHSAGLVAYWKFDEGNGSIVKDYVSGNDLSVYDMSNAPMRWTQVELPKKNN